eukprot:1677401-Lingulodinium_polyedra.AAC.1
MLARAAWGVYIPGPYGGTWAGPADGAQTAQRGELLAAAAGRALATQDLILITDNRYARNGVLKLAAGAVPDEWRHADLWHRLRSRARLGTLCA